MLEYDCFINYLIFSDSLNPKFIKFILKRFTVDLNTKYISKIGYLNVRITFKILNKTFKQTKLLKIKKVTFQDGKYV